MQAMTLGRVCVDCMKVIPRHLSTNIFTHFNFKTIHPAIFISVRYRKNWQNPYVRQLYKRRLEAGPETERHRSVWSNWNYDSEIYAFGKRLGEEFNDDTIRQAFTHRSYLEGELSKRAELGMEEGETTLLLDDNETFAETGFKFASDYISHFIRTCYPHLPEEGINHVRDYLVSEEVAVVVASNCGMKDLMLCADFPPKHETLAMTLYAVIGALLKDQGTDKAEAFVCDLVITELIGKDINDLWPITNPMGLLREQLASQGRSAPEPRLTRHTGDETVMAVYHVGVYCDRQLIGEGPGETVPIAEEMAARDALKRLWGTEDHRRPLLLGKARPTVGENARIQDASVSQTCHGGA